MSARFVGRHRELAALTGLIRGAIHARSAGAALVSGDPGSGKTRLLVETLRLRETPRVVRLVGFEPMQQVPLGAAADLLRVLADAPGDGVALDRLVFGSGDDQAPDPLRIFEAAHRALAASGALLIAIDDLQWVDERSVALVHYLLRSAGSARQPLVVISMARPAPVTAAFRAGLEADLVADRRIVLDLAPLDLADGLSLVRSLDADVDERTGAALWQRASGSPFWLEALARSRGTGDPADLILDRLLHLGPDAGALMSMLAVAGRPLTDAELARIQGWADGRIRGAARELVARGLALEVAGTIGPAHDLIREATVAGLPTATRNALHARLADWIETDAGEDLPALREALGHRLASGRPAVALALRLLASPRRRLLNGDDLRLLASISDDLRPGSAERVTIDRGLGELGALVGELDLALERWGRVSVETAEPTQARDAEIEAARAAYRLGRSRAAHDHLDRARALTPERLEAAVRLDALQADVELWLDHQTTVGRETAERAVAAAEELTSAAGGAEALPPATRRAHLAAVMAAIDGAMQEDRDDAIIELADQCLEIARGVDDEAQIVAQMRVGQALRTVARPIDGEAESRRAWESAKHLVLPLLTVEAGYRLARALRDLGRLHDAHAVALETGALETRLTNAPRLWGGGASVRHLLELSIADPAAALRALGRDAEAEPDPHYRQDIHLAIAIWQARTVGAKAGAEVERRLLAAAADAALARCPRHSNGLVLSTAELLGRIGRIEEARRGLAEWDLRPGTSRVSRELWRQRTVAAIAAAEGDVETAAETLEAYAPTLERAGLKLELIWTRIDLGRCLATADRTRAVAALTAAAELADACGAASEGRLATQLLRQLGVRAWRRGRGEVGDGIAGLSEREREVASLIAEGSSNREIADRLVVSPKTVERHVTNILAKLGMRNRTELASRILSASVRVSPDE